MGERERTSVRGGEPIYGVKTIKNVMVPMPDGVRIAADVFMPHPQAGTRPGRYPGVIEAYPYRKDDQSVALTRAHRYFARRGYVSLLFDVRGTGASEGIAEDEYCRQEQLDLVAAIDWISRQEWCTGSVGMFGSSYGGFNSVQVGMHRPPALKAIVPINYTDNRYTDDCHYLGGSLQMLYDLGGYGLGMVVRNIMPPYPQYSGADWARLWEERRLNEPWLLRWLAHQTYDEQWKNGSLCEDYGAIEAATFLISGWRDGYGNVVLRTFENLRCPRKAWIGPWTHSRADNGAPGPAVNMWREIERFYAHWLKGEANGIMDEPPITIYVQKYDPPAASRRLTTGYWRGEPGWPLARASERAFYLAPGGGLADGAPGVEARGGYSYRATVGTTAPTFSGGGGTLPLDQRHEEGFVASWTTAPLTEGFEILGYGRLELGVAVTTDIATVVARLIDIAPDGAAALIARGVLNLTHRDSHEHPSPVEPGKVYRVTVPLDATSWVFEPGHRIRLTLAGADFPRVWPSPKPYEAEVVLGGAGGSRLVLPVVAPPERELPVPAFESPAGLETLTTSQTIEPGVWQTIHNHHDGTVQVRMAGVSRTRVSEEISFTGGRRALATASERDPAAASMRGESWVTLHWPSREIDCRAIGTLESTVDTFHVTVDLNVTMDGMPHFSRRWMRSIPRHLL